MTREEREQALEWFKNRPITMSGAKKMYDLAISALEQPEPCEDTISRQAAIDALADMHCKSDEDGYVWIIRSDAWARIDALPSVTPERKTGKWERAYLDHEAMGERPSILYCSVCNQCIAYPVNFCPNCGADMRGEQDENR